MATKAQKTPQNYVRLLVREYALKTGEFTLDQMVELTRCKRSSVQTEIRRMSEEGLLTSEHAAGPRSGPGQPPVVYKLTSELNKVSELVEQIRNFRPTTTPSYRPESRSYSVARRLLDTVASSDLSESERNAYLSEARDLLAIAWAEEGNSKLPKDGLLQYEQGRLSFLKGDYESAEPLFEAATKSLGDAELFSAERAKIEEHNLAIGIRKAMSELNENVIGRVLEAMRDRQISKPAGPEHPFQSAVTEALETIARQSPTQRTGFIVVDSGKAIADTVLRDRVVKRVWKYASLRRSEEYRSAGYLARHKRYSGRYLVRGVDPSLGLREKLSQVGQSQVEELELSLAVRGPTEILPAPPRLLAKV